MADEKVAEVPEFDIETPTAAIIVDLDAAVEETSRLAEAMAKSHIVNTQYFSEVKQISDIAFTRVISNGREVNWRKEGDTWYCHNGDGRVVTSDSWDRFQAYLDNTAGFPG